MNIIDMHCDTVYQIHERRRSGESSGLCSDDRLHITLDKMKQGDYLLQNFAAFVDLKEAKERHDSPEAPYLEAKELIRIFHEETDRYHDRIGAVRTFAELTDNEKQGKMSALLTVEEGGVCCGESGKLREFYADGVRMMTLTWNYENEIGYPAAMQPQGGTYRAGEKRCFGLKETGLELLAEMESLGMIVDVSHLSDDGFFDICEHAKKPFAASHSNARALCGHPRNLSDPMLRMLGEHGGVSGLNLCPEFVIARKNEHEERIEDGKGLLEYLACHAIHMMDVGGSSCVGLGTDFDGFHESSEPKDASAMQDFAWMLHKLHVSDDQIDNILYRNVYRLYEELL